MQEDDSIISVTEPKCQHVTLGITNFMIGLYIHFFGCAQKTLQKLFETKPNVIELLFENVISKGLAHFRLKRWSVRMDKQAARMTLISV